MKADIRFLKKRKRFISRKDQFVQPSILDCIVFVILVIIFVFLSGGNEEWKPLM